MSRDSKIQYEDFNMSRSIRIQYEALKLREYGGVKDPQFYAAKRRMRVGLGNPPLIEILRGKVTVIDHDMTVHVV